MESNNEYTVFTVVADNEEALLKALNYVNFQTKSDYRLISFESHEVGLGTLQVTTSKMAPEFLFMMGKYYYIYMLDMKKSAQ